LFLVLKLPVYPESVEELKIIRFWLEVFANYFYGNLFARPIRYIFNPDMIKLLFGNEAVAPFQLYGSKAFFELPDFNFDYLWKFFDYININESLKIELPLFYNFNSTSQKSIERCNNFLFKILLSKGDRISEVVIED